MSAPHPIAPHVPSHLARQRQEELEALFRLLPPARATELGGHHRGALLALLGVQSLPRALSFAVHRALATPLVPWSGKSFEGEGGVNRWLGVHGLAFGRFRCVEAESPMDGLPSLLLDYDLPENPRALRPIVGEARRLNDGLVLARMNYRGRARLRTVLYFTLSETDGRA